MEVTQLLCKPEEASTLHCRQEFTLYCLSQFFSSTFNQQLTVVELQGVYYLLGVQVAKLTGRCTSNLYRSLKRQGVQVKRASSNLVRFLNSHRLPFAQAAHSITLVPLLPLLECTPFSVGGSGLRKTSAVIDYCTTVFSVS